MILRALVFLWFSVLSADLLYLYYAGGWIEPITVVRITESIVLYAFIPLGIFLSVKELTNFARSCKL